MDKLLPIGTIVLLKGGTKRVLLVGYLPQEVNSPKVYDYSGVPFPEGLIDSRKILLINHDQIEKVCHESIEDEEATEFINKVIELKKVDQE